MGSLVFLIDVDNTLLDNDRLKSDLAVAVESLIGAENSSRFWKVYEAVRKDDQYVDYPDTIERFAKENPSLPIGQLRRQVMEVDFKSYLYPHALEALDYLNSIGEAVIVSDGDAIYQRLKIEHSGIAARVDGRYVLTVHKQHELQQLFETYPAEKYAIIDDKSSILADVRRTYPTMTTVLVCQGKYANAAVSPRPDLILAQIGDLLRVSRTDFLSGGIVPETIHSN